jgi:hypothetical protein
MMCGSTIALGSKLQCAVALSTARVDYVALSASTQEFIFLRQLLTNLGEHAVEPTSVFEDAEACEALDTNAVTTAKTKHIEIRHPFVRGLVKSKALEIVWILSRR